MNNKKCVLCGTSLDASHIFKNLHFHRWVKHNNGTIKHEKTWISLPICSSCNMKYHPNIKFYYKFVFILNLVVLLSILCSVINRELFCVNLIEAIITLVVFCGLGSVIILGGFVAAFSFYEDCYEVTINVSPYKELPVVEYIIKNGFSDINDNSHPYVIFDEKFVSFMDVRDTIKNKYNLK